MPNHFTLIFSAAKGAVYYVAITTVIFSFAKNNMLFSPRVKISCFYAKAHLVFQWGLYNKRMPLNSSLPDK